MVEQFVLFLLLVIVPVRVQDSRCKGLGPVSWGLLIPAGIVVAWSIFSNLPIYVGILDVHVSCMCNVVYIINSLVAFRQMA
jgi:hypothetical protein